MEPTSGKYDVPVASYQPGTHPNNNVVEQVFQGATKAVFPSVAAMCVYHPLYCVKTMLQADAAKNMREVAQKVMKDPKILVRGMGTSVFCSVPLAVVGAINDYAAKWYGGVVKRDLTETEKMYAAMGASASGGVFATVFDQVVVRQQLSGDSFVNACGFVRKNGIKGFWVTVIRETKFGLFVFGVSPWANKKIRQCFAGEGASIDYATATVTSLVCGVFGAVISQPTDVIKTKVQSNVGMTYSKAVRDLSSQGMRAFFKGLVPRAIGFAVVTNVITVARQVLDQVFDKKQK